METGKVFSHGAGNIGLGLVGAVMHSAGYEVVLSDANQQRVERINSVGGYDMETVSREGTMESHIDNVRAISSFDEEAVIREIVEADVITTAVGANILPRVAPTLAKGLMARMAQRPHDDLHVAVIALENMDRNTETLRDHLFATLPDDRRLSLLRDKVSFPNCIVDRIVPGTKDEPGQPLKVVAEDYFQIAIDETALLADLAIPGIQKVSDLRAIAQQKLNTLNGPHSFVAYLTAIKGYETIDAGMADPSIYALVRGQMEEVSGVTVRHSSITAEEQQLFVDKTLDRFLNPYLHDDPLRVGRQPKRKLGPNDRLLHPALLAIEDGETPAYLNMAIVGALRFKNPEDEQAVALQHEIAQYGVDHALVAVTGLAQTHPIVRQATAAWHLAELAA